MDRTSVHIHCNMVLICYPPLIELTYNEDGHLIRDEEKRTLGYDSLGRLISVALPGETPRSYSYDPVDKVSGLNGQGGPEKRFYQGDKLASQIKGANSSTFMRGDDVVLAEHQAGADPKSLLMAGDDKNSVLTEVSKAGRKGMVYAPYGHRADDASVSSHLGFNGERREGQTGWYMLGNGYRVFNTVLGRFHSPDSWSPFGKGGVNGYAYVQGNPIGNTDSTGHFAWPTFGSFMRLLGIATKANKAAAEMAARALKAQGSIVPVATPEVFAGAKLVNLKPAAGGSFTRAATKFNDFVDFKASESSAVKTVANYNKVLGGVAKGKIFAKPAQINNISAKISNIQNEVLENSVLSREFFEAQPRTNLGVQLADQAIALDNKYPRYETPENIMKAVRQIKSAKSK
ncbi:RHS repeat-associated core domain-containing protein [Pseudomonas sp. NPDC086251]|uniref:RHS repeat-associated core domain-containing protein n=1 Tax=Pseudomonas sp. NPDC086251 TaxID=3364431 RepID=UPI0038382999